MLLSEDNKWSPLIASPSHSKFIYPCCVTTQHSHVQLTAKKRACPLGRERALLRVTLVSPTEWIRKLQTETCSCILLLPSQTADRLVLWVRCQKANLASLILWDVLGQGLLSRFLTITSAKSCTSLLTLKPLTYKHVFQIIENPLNHKHTSQTHQIHRGRFSYT